MPHEPLDHSKLAEDQLDELYRKIQGGDEGDSVDEQVLKARAALNLINRVRDANKIETAKAGDTFRGDSGAAIFHGAELDGLPSQIGRFEIREPIGQGGFGMVFLARDPNLDRDIALKIPRPEAITTPDLKARFLREGRSVAALAHPNIVPVYESGQIGSVCYLASQYVDGETLADWASQHENVAPLTAAEICQAIAQGLAHAHQRGVLHRDIKPSNILVERPKHGKSKNEQGKDNESLVDHSIRNRIRITDFGLAKTMGDDAGRTQTGALIGTPSYMSPEQASQTAASELTDVYSAGAVLYFLLTGKPPFARDTLVETIQDVIQAEPVAPSRINSTVPRDLEAICLKCLEKEPGQRYASAFELHDDLIRFQNAEPVKARSVTEIDRFVRWTRRNPSIAGSLSAAFLFLAIGMVASVAGWIATSRALERESTALRNETAALRSEKNANQLARERYLAHKEAIDTYFLNVSENAVLKSTPGTRPLRQELLGLALGYYEQYVNERQQDSTLASDVAEAETRIAQIFQEMEENEIALRHAQHAVELLDAALSEGPSKELAYMKSLALYQVFAATSGLGKLDESLPVLAESIDLLKTLSEDPDAIDANMKWAQYTADYASKLHQTGMPDEAESKFDEAAVIYEAIALTNDSPDVQLKLLDISGSLAVLQKQSGDIDGAIERQKGMFNQLSGLIQAHPHRWDAVESYVITGLNLSGGLLMKRRTAEASEILENTDSVSQRLHVLFPSNEKYVQFRAGLFLRLGVLMDQQGDSDAELALLAKAADFYRERFELNPGSARYKSMLASGLTNLATIRTRERSDLDEAEVDNDYAIELLREMIVADPHTVDHKLSLAGGLRSRSLLHLLAGRFQEALEPIDETIEICDQVIAKKVRESTVRDFRMDAFIFAGKAHYNLGHFEEAVASWNDALNSEAPSLPRIKDSLTISIACALEKMGNHATATETIATVDLENLIPKDMVSMAQFHSIIALSSDDPDDWESASQWIHKAFQQGYFSKAWQVAEFDSKKVFDELKNRPAIRGLLDQIRSRENGDRSSY